VGGSGVLVDMGVLWVLSDPATLGWNLTLSKVIAAEAAMVTNFLLNDVWTFRGLTMGACGWRERLIRFGKFNLICLVGIVWSVLLLQMQVRWFGLNVYLANFISIGVVSVWNFGMNLKFGWTTAPRKTQPVRSQGNLS
jgi:dolichol-phosphate mannosyltransferase